MTPWQHVKRILFVAYLIAAGIYMTWELLKLLWR